MELNLIRDNHGARMTSKRAGRGEGSGLGKTCGRGVKGQKARSGVAIAGFEGGQNPLYMRLPKRGFNNIFRKKFEEVSLGKLQLAIDKKILDASQPIDIDALKNAGLIKRSTKLVKLINTGELTAAVQLTVSKATANSKIAVEQAKGTLTQLIAA